MKAIILAAGKGERLKEITETIPKPMIRVKGKPILEHNIELCRKYGIKEIYINLYHLPEKITTYFGNGENFGVNIYYSREEELLGTAGGVKRIVQKFWSKKIKEDDFFVLYGDNYSDYNLQALIDKKNETNADCVIAFHYREDVSHSGVAEFDDEMRIKKFIEKPKEGETDSHWVNAGIYLVGNSIISNICDGNCDFGKEVFPKLLNTGISLYGVCANSDVRAYDTKEMYNKNISL